MKVTLTRKYAGSRIVKKASCGLVLAQDAHTMRTMYNGRVGLAREPATQVYLARADRNDA